MKIHAFSANSFIIWMMVLAVLYMSFVTPPPCPCLVLFGSSPGPVTSSITWTAVKMKQLAKDPRMMDAVETLVDKRPYELPQLKAAIDAATDGEIRRAILQQVQRRKTSKDRLYIFAAESDASATCSTEEAAGGSGLTDCMSACAPKDVFYAGSCYALCSLAVSPCGGRPFSLMATGATLVTGAERVRTLVECLLLKLPRLSSLVNATDEFSHKLVVLVVGEARFATHVCGLPVWGVLYNGVTEIMVAYPRVALFVTGMAFTMFCWTLFKRHARRRTLAVDVRDDARDCPRPRASTLPARMEPLHAEASRPRARSVG